MDFVSHKAVSWAKNQIEARKTQVAHIGTIALATYGGASMALPTVFADENTDAINDTFTMAGAIFDGLGDLVPHILHLIVKLFPLAIVAMLLGLLFAIFAAIPAYFLIIKPKMGKS